MPAKRPRLLILGASVAGPVLAYWLERFGFVPAVIERTTELRLGKLVISRPGCRLDDRPWDALLLHLAARLRRMHTTFGGSAGGMLDGARFPRPDELPQVGRAGTIDH